MNYYEVVELMGNNNYISHIDGFYIIFHYNDLSEYEFKINIKDINFTNPLNITRYLIGYYELSFKDEIDIIDKIKRREERLSSLLD